MVVAYDYLAQLSSIRNAAAALSSGKPTRREPVWRRAAKASAQLSTGQRGSVGLCVKFGMTHPSGIIRGIVSGRRAWQLMRLLHDELRRRRLFIETHKFSACKTCHISLKPAKHCERAGFASNQLVRLTISGGNRADTHRWQSRTHTHTHTHLERDNDLALKRSTRLQLLLFGCDGGCLTRAHSAGRIVSQSESAR